jgi:RNase P subunit RPR2
MGMEQVPCPMCAEQMSVTAGVAVISLRHHRVHVAGTCQHCGWSLRLSRLCSGRDAQGDADRALSRLTRRLPRRDTDRGGE